MTEMLKNFIIGKFGNLRRMLYITENHTKKNHRILFFFLLVNLYYSEGYI